MKEAVTDLIRLKADRGRLEMLLCIAVVFFIVALVGYPPTPFFWVLRIITIAATLLGIVVFATGIVMDRDGFEFGTFLGRRRFKWTEIKSVLVINAVSGKEVCLELRTPVSATDAKRFSLQRLPGRYGMEADELAKTLMRWQREYGQTHGN